MLIFQEVFLKTIFLKHTHLPDIVLNGRTAPLSATIVLHETLDSMRKSITVLSATKNILFCMTISTGCFRTNVFSSISITHAYYVFFNFQPSRRQNSMAAN